MVTASGETLQGGDQEIDLEMDFGLKNSKRFDTKTEENTVSLRGKFHDADIENALILGYPWAVQNGLNIFPAQDALACGLQNEILLGGWGARPREYKSRNVWQIRKRNMCIVDKKEMPAEDSGMSWQSNNSLKMRS